ncbi:MAG: putative hydrolase [Myxococcaceae bacterium]|nr:putative hydrolase [Myxococcaceae bacterium]
MTARTRLKPLVRRARFYGALTRAVGGAALQRVRGGKTHPDWPLAYELVVPFLRVTAGEFYDFGVVLARKRVSPITPSIARKVELSQRRIAGLDADVHTPRRAHDGSPLKTVLFLHGGGYVTCSPRSHRDVIARIAESAHARCIAPDYRLAPAHPFPAALQDALACYRALLAEGVSPDSLFVAGDSAGGGLTVSLAHALYASGEPLPRGLVLLSPWLDLTLTREALSGQGHGDYLGAHSIATNALQYADRDLLSTPAVSPLQGDLHGLPPILMETGEWEVLREQNERFAQKARAAGVEVQHTVVAGMLHAFPCFSAILPQGVAALARVGAFIRAH